MPAAAFWTGRCRRGPRSRPALPNEERSGTERAMRVLVVEDHPRLAETGATVLRREGIAVDVAFDGREALGRVALADYDVVVLDRDLPGVHGDDVCRAMVAAGSPSRVLMRPAAGTRENGAEGLGIAPDDSLAKPFRLAERVARVRAL